MTEKPKPTQKQQVDAITQTILENSTVQADLNLAVNTLPLLIYGLPGLTVYATLNSLGPLYKKYQQQLQNPDHAYMYKTGWELIATANQTGKAQKDISTSNQ